MNLNDFETEMFQFLVMCQWGGRLSLIVCHDFLTNKIGRSGNLVYWKSNT